MKEETIKRGFLMLLNRMLDALHFLLLKCFLYFQIRVAWYTDYSFSTRNRVKIINGPSAQFASEFHGLKFACIELVVKF